MTTHNLIPLPTADEAVRITPPGLHSGMDITVQNVNTSGYIYLGGEGVSTTSYGFKLAPGSAFSVELPETNALFAVGNADDLLIAVLSFGLEK